MGLNFHWKTNTEKFKINQEENDNLWFELIILNAEINEYDI